MVKLLWKSMWKFLKKKLKTELAYDTALARLDIYLKDPVSRDTCTHAYRNLIHNSYGVEIV